MLVHGQHLFPLHLLGSNIGTSYFMDRNGGVFSARTGNLVQLRGSRTNSGTYFKFGQQWGSGWRHDTLKQRAMAHKEWLKHTVPPSDEKVQVDTAVGFEKPLANRAHAPNVEVGIKAKGSLIARVHKGKLVFGSDPKIHTTDQSVRDEMLRLATSHPGTKFVELTIAKAVVAGGLSWE